MTSRSRGFSLLEMIIVIVIISLLALLVTPTLTKTIANMELKSSVKRVSAILRSCRNDAVNKHRVYQVNFNRESNVVGVCSAQEGQEQFETLNSYPLPKDIRMDKIEVAKTFLESTLPSFEFYPNGSANGGTAVLRGGEGPGYSIEVDALTGTVKIGEAKER
jgi:general secretion pathway protein H